MKALNEERIVCVFDWANLARTGEPLGYIYPARFVVVIDAEFKVKCN